CSDRRRLVRDANTIKVLFKDLIFEFYAIVCSYDDDRRLKKDSDSLQKDFEEFMNVFMRIGFGSTIKLVSYDKGQVVTFKGKFICIFRNSDCGTGSQSNNTFGSPHGFVIHEINGLIVIPGNANQNPNRKGNVVAARAKGNAIGNNDNQIICYNCRGLDHLARNCTVRLRRRDAAYLQTQLLIAQKEEAGIQHQVKEFNLMIAAIDLDEIEKVNANYIFMANLQQALTSSTQTDKAPVYALDGSAEASHHGPSDAMHNPSQPFRWQSAPASKY
nr:hypothetical protein [Tanacetum cinerariifolium]